MNVCCVCGKRGTYPDITAQSEQRGPDGRGWEPLYGCADLDACFARLMTHVHAATPRTAPPALSAVRGA
jgi:hypothetical protein